jgi:hypothetical protein
MERAPGPFQALGLAGSMSGLRLRPYGRERVRSNRPAPSASRSPQPRPSRSTSSDLFQVVQTSLPAAAPAAGSHAVTWNVVPCAECVHAIVVDREGRAAAERQHVALQVYCPQVRCDAKDNPRRLERPLLGQDHTVRLLWCPLCCCPAAVCMPPPRTPQPGARHTLFWVGNSNPSLVRARFPEGDGDRRTHA